MHTSTASYWGPSLLLLASSVGLGACRLPGASVESGSAPPNADEAEQRRSEPRQLTAPMPKARGFGIVDAELAGDGQRLLLSFSREVGSTRGVDPNDFRLSMGFAYSYRRYAYAYYYDVGYYSGDSDELASFVSINAEADTIELTLAHPFELSYCFEMQAEIRSMQAEPGIKARGGLFLHYAPGREAVRDARGSKLGAAAAQWVIARREADDPEDAAELYFEGAKARRAFNGAIPVRCGPAIPPGPR